MSQNLPPQAPQTREEQHADCVVEAVDAGQRAMNDYLYGTEFPTDIDRAAHWALERFKEPTEQAVTQFVARTGGRVVAAETYNACMHGEPEQGVDTPEPEAPSTPSFCQDGTCRGR